VFTPGCNASPMDIDDSYGRYLYVADFGADAISGYAIQGKTGTLTLWWSIPGFPRALTTKPTGRSLFVGGGGDFIESFGIHAGNGVADRRTSNFPAPSRIRSDPSGNFFYGVATPNLGAG
jgi:6-phosphogluconolactonase (cycloisomerase 2 family)